MFKALSCITNRLDSVNDTYATALVTYTLMLAKHSNASKMMKLLKDKAVKEGRVEIFSKPGCPLVLLHYHRIQSFTFEVTFLTSNVSLL